MKSDPFDISFRQNAPSAVETEPAADPLQCPVSQALVNVYTVATPIGQYALKVCRQGVHGLDHISKTVTHDDVKTDSRSAST